MTKKRDKIKYLNCIQKSLLLIIFSIFFIPIVTAGNYTGNSSICKTCHEEQYALWTNSTHTSKLITRDDAMARGYPNPPGGYSWDNVSFAIGSKWKIRYVNDTGYIITNGGKNQFNIDDQIWTDYNPNVSKPYICGNCHNTGYLSNVTNEVKEPFRTLRAQGQLADGVYDNSLTPGFTGYWAENSIGCEACHGQGGDHVNSPSKLNIRNASVVRDSPGICGNCHSRPNTGEYETLQPYPYGVNDTLLNDTLYDSSPMPTVNYSKVGGHHEQWEDWKASVHANNSNQSVTCVSCHGGHSISNPAYAGGPTGKTAFTNGSVYPAAVNITCTNCHSVAQPKHGYYTENTECISCHMPINRKSANKMDLRSHWFNVNALKDNKNGNPHGSTNFDTLQAVTESCVTCHSSANLSKPIDIASAGVHKDVNKSEGIGLLNSSDCKSCHNSASASAIQNRTCENCHIDQVITSPKVDEHTNRSTEVTVTANCALCHNNSINKFKLSSNASVGHYGTVNSLINTSNCIDCHNGAYTENASWGSPVNISTSTKRKHTETQTSQCDLCHKDSSVPTLAAVTFHNASVETALPPPVNQNIGIYDTRVSNLIEQNCRNCHSSGVPDRHHNLVANGNISKTTNTTFGCQDCHPVVNGSQVLIDRNCVACHTGTAFYANPTKVNISRPHHIYTQAAQDRDCKQCHGSYVANYNDGHYIPTYNTSSVTPEPHYKVYNATSGRAWGGCYACHQELANASPAILDQYGNHHNAINGDRYATDPIDHKKDATPGRGCKWCHTVNSTDRPLGYPNELDMEFRNSSWQIDPANLTGCEQCHDVGTIHNIQKDYANTSGQKGYGHIGTNWDCNGCHAFWDAGDIAPMTGAIIPDVESVTPTKLIPGTSTVVTITGSNFVSGSGTYTSVVSIDGATTLTPSYVADNKIVVTVPALAAGVHTIQVMKTGDANGDKLSKLTALTVVEPVDIVTATITKKTSLTEITITGSGFGSQPDAAFKDLGAFVSTISKKGQQTTTKLTVVSWTNTQIVATTMSVNAGATVTIKAVSGQDSAVLTR